MVDTRDYTNYNQIFKNLCMKGSISEINEFIRDKGRYISLNWGMRGACEGGRKEIVELMLSKGASPESEGLRYACKGGNKDVIEFIISKGFFDHTEGMRGACEGGRKEIIEFMVQNDIIDKDYA